jgi:hypothetical protein
MSKNADTMSGWVGWVGFAGFMLMLGGMFSLLMGFVALFKDAVIYSSASGAMWILDYTQWGWIHMLIGVLALGAAGSLVSGHMYGRVIAVLVALASAVANMAFLPMYPFWSIIVITVNVLIIYAVITHGGDLLEG